MATLEYLWDLSDTNNNLVDQAESSVITASQNTGEPSIAFTCGTRNTAESERGLSTEDTWEGWGVPTGATVTNLSANWLERTEDDNRLTSHDVVLDIRDTTGNISVITTSALGSASLSITPSVPFIAHPESTVSVESAYSASNTAIRMSAYYTIATGGGSPTTDWRLGNINTIVTYTLGGATRRVFIVL